MKCTIALLVALAGVGTGCPENVPDVPPPRIVGPGTPLGTDDDVCAYDAPESFSFRDYELLLAFEGGACGADVYTRTRYDYIRFRRPDGSAEFRYHRFISEISSAPLNGDCRVTWVTTAEISKDGMWIPATPVDADVVLCGISLHSPLAAQLGPAQLHNVEAGPVTRFVPLVPLSDPTPLAVQAGESAACDGDGAHALIDAFDYSHRTVLSIPLDTYDDFGTAGVNLSVRFLLQL